MNGTTILPKDKDPAIAIKEQMKLKMECLRLDEGECFQILGFSYVGLQPVVCIPMGTIDCLGVQTIIKIYYRFRRTRRRESSCLFGYTT